MYIYIYIYKYVYIYIHTFADTYIVSCASTHMRISALKS